MRRRLLFLSLIAATGVAILAAFPIAALEVAARTRLRLHGVRSRTLGALQALERDRCRDTDPARCACVALVHGLADSSLTWTRQLEKTDWRAPLRLVAVDLPGNGRSPAPPRTEDYRVRSQARLLRAALEPVCPRWTVVGNSLGGWIAAWLALDWPQGVEGLVLVDAAGLTMAENIGALFLHPTRETLEWFQKASFARPESYPDFLWRAAVDRIAHSNAPATVRVQDVRDLLGEHLRRIEAPTIVLWGALDRVFPPAQGRKLAESIPGAEWREIPDCGHVPQKECPAPVAEAIEKLVAAQK